MMMTGTMPTSISMTSVNPNSAASRYTSHSITRQQFLDRARECSRITIPTVMPPSAYDTTRKLPQPYQTVGARGVTNLASKLLLSLFPANVPFFRFVIDDFTVQQIGGGESRGVVEKALNRIERSVMSDVEGASIRSSIAVALVHLIVCGNVLLYIDPKTAQVKVYPMDRYICERDPMGNPTMVVVEETVAFSAIPDDIKDEVKHLLNLSSLPEHELAKKEVPIHTSIDRRSNGSWSAHQEIAGKVIETTRGTYKEDLCPWLPLRMTPVPGASYGSSFVENLLGDLTTLDELRKAILKFSGAAAKIVFLVHPNATTKAKDLAKAESGDFVQGNITDIDVLQIEKYNDFQVVKQMSDETKRDLEIAFLLNTAVQRNAERVTAEEIRQVIQELETGLGGIHSVLAQELQLPIVKILLDKQQRDGKMPKLPKGAVRPQVITGIEALGRGTDLQNLRIAANELVPFGEAMFSRLNLGEYADRIFASLGVDTTNLIKSEEQMQAEQQQQMMQQMAQQAAPGVAQEAMKGAVAGQQQQAEQPPNATQEEVPQP